MSTVESLTTEGIQNLIEARFASENVNVVPAAGSLETIPEPLIASVSYITLDTDTTLFFPTASTGKSFTVVLKQDATGSRTVTWPGIVKWAGGIAPILTTTPDKEDVFSFMCVDGTNFLGFVAGKDF